jgi:hypothetical protein
MKPILIAMTLFSMGVLMASPVSAASGKNQYWLFKPTPRDQMRELAADRPDKTESPHSVDAGHFQMESSIISYTYDKRNPDYSGDSTHGFAVMPTLFKMGITNFMDFQVGIEPYVSNFNYSFATSTTENVDGFGDVTLRLKIALVGNDEGAFALGAMPFVSIPTKKNDAVGEDHIQGGIIFPWALDLPKDWGLGGQTQVDWAHNVNTNGFHPEFINTFELTYGISERFGSYLEFYSQVSHESGVPWVGTVDTGVTFAATDNLQFDIGVNLGVTRSADDVNPFIGFTWRH